MGIYRREDTIKSFTLKLDITEYMAIANARLGRELGRALLTPLRWNVR